MVTAEQLKSSMNNYIRQNITAKDTTTSQQLGIYKNVYGLPSNVTQSLAKLQELQHKAEIESDPMRSIQRTITETQRDINSAKIQAGYAVGGALKSVVSQGQSAAGMVSGTAKSAAQKVQSGLSDISESVGGMFTQVSSIPARIMNGIGSAFGKAMDVFQTFGIMALIGVIAIGALLYGMRKEVFGFFKGKNMVIVTLALLILALGVISIVIPPLGDEWVLGVIGILGLVVA